MRKLVLAEKPSVGRDLARVLGCRNNGKFCESADYIVTWALGHLITPADPGFYGPQYKRWSLNSLPILPSELENIVIEKTKDQYALVESLLKRDDVESVIIATDAGREGELVARWILKQARCTKPVERLWISSQTDAAINQGFATLKNGDEYLNLYHAAECRSAADWYVGYNVSRAMSCYFDTALSAGRVQTPTLALMTKREDEINSFTGKFYWTLKADFGAFCASRFNNGTIRIESEDEVKKLEAELTGAKGKVVSVSEVLKEEKPPLAYDLTELQRDANTVLGFSAKETLDTLQRLYEVHKVVTYPRTDSRYITADIVPTLDARLKALGTTAFGARAQKLTETGYRVDYGRFVDDTQVGDHHALLPTEQKVDVSKFNAQEKALWELVIMRFLEVISPDYKYNTTTITADVKGSTFISRLSIPADLGWRGVGRDIGRSSACALEDEDSRDRISLRSGFKEGDILEINSITVKRNATLAPERYTEASLLYAMEHAGRFVEDTKQKKYLVNGLGTPATRADIIEKLIQNNCIERKGRELVPTAKGMELVRLVPDQLKSPELTAKWEERLSAISLGEEDPGTFIEDVKNNARDLVRQVCASRLKYNPSLMGGTLCPFCGWPMVRIEDEYGQVHNVCQRFSCGYEEMLTKVRKAVPAPAVAPAPVQKVVVVKAKPVTSEDGKKKLVVKKPAVSVKSAEPAVTYVWETQTVVVKPSRYRAPEKNFDRKPRTETPRPAYSKPKEEVPLQYKEHKSSSGGTFADFFAAQKEREERDRSRKKK